MTKIIIKYIICFFVFGLIGWLFEKIVLKKNHSFCLEGILDKLKLCLPLLVLYGAGGVLLLFIKEYVIKNHIILYSFISAIVLSIAECIGGKVSLHMTKRKKWNYEEFPLCMCDGYVALPPFLLWLISAAVFFKIYDCIYK